MSPSSAEIGQMCNSGKSNMGSTATNPWVTTRSLHGINWNGDGDPSPTITNLTLVSQSLVASCGVIRSLQSAPVSLIHSTGQTRSRTDQSTAVVHRATARRCALAVSVSPTKERTGRTPQVHGPTPLRPSVSRRESAHARHRLCERLQKLQQRLPASEISSQSFQQLNAVDNIKPSFATNTFRTGRPARWSRPSTAV